MKKLLSIHTKLSLLMSSQFMSLIKYRKDDYNQILDECQRLINTGYSEKELDKYFSKNYGFNEYDVSWLTNDAKKGNIEQDSTSEEKPVEKKPNPKLEYDTPAEEVDKEFEEWDEATVNDGLDKLDIDLEPEEEEIYNTDKVSIKEVEVGDVCYLGDELYMIEKRRRNKITLQNLYNGKVGTIRTKEHESLNILTDESLESVVKDFVNEKLFERLPKQIREDFNYLI